MSASGARIYRGRARVDALDPADRGLAYGDGLFSTLRVHAGQPVWWDAHWARLARDAARLGLAVPDADWLRGEVDALLAAQDGPAVLKLVLTRGAGGRGYRFDADAAPTLVLSRHPLPPAARAPLSLRWCRLRMARQPALAGIKHLNRLEQVLARAEWDDPAIDEGLLLDTDGRVACATSANVFARIEGRWLTPRVDACGVAGVARAWVLAHAPDAAEATLAPAALEAADALFLCNAVRGILPVGRLGDRTWAPHPALAELQRHLGRAEPAFLGS
ncbi:MAG TPA: aminodeoxychorismate lyase [Arenimonas sp.]|uniref:aminodeoxychorismate lyase n=1 Tax=Arenimonas sp. TaxID=1872635 RepID=UPI002D80EF58|nr:aminodeoxychorismate lyase [Arenimonas sp.]HEU0153100.1 aminodeoxychorismate lyase [Arenimonas sp.]